MNSSTDNNSYAIHTWQLENDIFISYTWQDNQPVREGKRGWISEFVRLLSLFAAGHLPKEPRIWKDDREPGNILTDEILEAVRKSAVFLSVLSPRYMESKWCQDEAREFYKTAKQTIGDNIANKSRIFKVMKVPVALEKQQPPHLQKLIGYEFYQFDPVDKKLLELRPEFGGEIEEQFYRKVALVAFEITKMIEMLKDVPTDYRKQNLTIYLAITTSDLTQEYEKLKYELQQRGHTVISNLKLPAKFDSIRSEIEEKLNRCVISIHLVGKWYGTIPEGTKQSIIEIQYELAAEYSRSNPGFSCLIWIPPRLDNQEREQERFIQSLQNLSEPIQTSFEDFKSIVQDKITSYQQAPERLELRKKVKRVYLIYDQLDNQEIGSLVNFLNNQEIEVLEPIFADEATPSAQVREYHETNLQICDAVLIYWGRGSANWLKMKRQDLLKTASSRSKDFLSKALYISNPLTPEKQRLQTPDLDFLIKEFAEFSCNSLLGFVHQVTRVQGGVSQ